MTGVRSLRVTLGPLKYLLKAHDGWGQRTIDDLRRHVAFLTFRGKPDRTFHLLREPADESPEESSQGMIPPELLALLPGGSPRLQWSCDLDTAHSITRRHSDFPECFWTSRADAASDSIRFRLPWPLIIEDMVSRGGGVVHAGLAVRREAAVLFSAPSGGGKSTALARIPAPWRVEADDAALVWPSGRGSVKASPLPTWSVMAGRSRMPKGLGRWKPGDSWRVGAIVVLEKSPFLEYSPFAPAEAAAVLYRALSDHPESSRSRHLFRKEFFGTACSLARSLPAFILRLGLNDAYWKLLERDIKQPRETGKILG